MDWLSEVSRVADANQWPHEEGETAVSMVVPGNWGAYQVVFEGQEDAGVLKVVGGFGLKLPPSRLAEVRQLILLANKRLEVGSFSYSIEDDLVAYAITLSEHADELNAASYQATALMVTQAVDTYYPAFMRLVWGLITPRAAIDELDQMAATKQ